MKLVISDFDIASLDRASNSGVVCLLWGDEAQAGLVSLTTKGTPAWGPVLYEEHGEATDLAIASSGGLSLLLSGLKTLLIIRSYVFD